jgi:hypothetical protein
VFVQVPDEATSVWPATASPEIVGRTVFTGSVAEADAISSAALAAVFTPTALEAVTLTESRWPTSPVTGT